MSTKNNLTATIKSCIIYTTTKKGVSYMDYRLLGKSDIKVSTLGYGAGHIGGENMSDKEVDKLLNEIVDLGINFIDTARGYNLSEERIGKFLSHKRDKIVLSTKVGYGIEGYQDWSYDIIIKGIEKALQLMKTDYIDVVHLHSCNLDILKRGEVIEALKKLKQDGKIRLMAYSGENEDLNFAIESNSFDVIQTSVNIFDQNGINNYFGKIIDKNIGVIAKRPLGNAPWRFLEIPYGNYCEEYWNRMKKMNIDTKGMSWNELALRFTAYTYGVTTCIVGSTNINHIKENIENVNKGKLPEDIYNEIRAKFNYNQENWIGQV
jgi:aryl-alcohol dehydrogenase-like predicted oxidoreductase